ncbi:MAG: hypothetical protein II304_08615 [Bacteroidales bacterium]|nr:hypothetical protein [Bacteroidales bacterium]
MGSEKKMIKNHYNEIADICGDCCEDCSICPHKEKSESLLGTLDLIDYIINHNYD